MEKWVVSAKRADFQAIAEKFRDRPGDCKADPKS